MSTINDLANGKAVQLGLVFPLLMTLLVGSQCS